MRAARIAIVQAVAERDDRFGLIVIDERRELVQRFARVIGRQHLPARRKGRALFEMQVGDDQSIFAGPVERAELVRDERLAANRERLVGKILEPDAFRFQHCPCSIVPHRFADQHVGGFAQQCVARLAVDLLPADLEQDRHRKW